MSCTKIEIADQLARVRKIHDLPKKYEGMGLDDVARIYFDLLSDVSPKALAFAVSVYLREDHDFWPKPGQLNARAKLWHAPVNGESLRAKFNRWESDPFRHAASGDASTPCPVCDAVWVWKPYEKLNGDLGPLRLTITHDSTLHREAGIGYAVP